MQQSRRRIAVPCLLFACGCGGFDARGYDGPVPKRGAAGAAGYSYYAGISEGGWVAAPPPPRPGSVGDWGPSGAGGSPDAPNDATGGKPTDPPRYQRAEGAAGEDAADAGASGDGGALGIGSEPGGASHGGHGGRVDHGGAAGGGGRAPAAGAGGRAAAGAAGAAGGSRATGAGGDSVAGAGGAPSPRLLFSEYVEGSASYKALELRALEASSLDGCRIATYFNGATTASTLSLDGALAAGQTYVLCTKSLATLLGDVCDRATNLTFNGNDAIALECTGVTLDVIGQIGFDPNPAWSAGDVSTANQTLRRDCSITHGDTTGSDAFDPSQQWQSAPKDDFSGLGASNCE